MTGINIASLRGGKTPAREHTEEQKMILAQAPHGRLVIEAGAGTGKTTVLVDYANKWSDKRGLYLAFNKEIANEAKLRFPPHIVAKTAHSYAFHALGVSKHKDRLVRSLRRQTIREAGIDISSPYLSPDRMVKAMINGITNFCNDSGKTLLPRHCGLEDSPPVTQEKVLPHVAATIKRFLDYETSGLPFTHDIYLKNLEMHGKIGSNVDYIMVDEAQDLNPVLTSLVLESGKPLILVGDVKQSIYAFRGAINAMEQIEGLRLPLSQSWRFGQEVADIANEILTNANEQPEHLLRGRPGHSTKVERYAGQASAKTFLLARTNARLFEGLVGNKKAPFWIAGGFELLANQLISALNLSKNDQYNVTDSYVRSFQNWEDMADEAAQGDSDAKRIVKIIKEYGDQIPELIERLRGLHRPAHQDAHLILSTAHKAKGLEAETVIVLDDFPTPRELQARRDDNKINSVDYDQEINLLYVAVTRAQNRLLLATPLYDEITQSMRNKKERKK